MMVVVDARILERNSSGTLVSGFWLLFHNQPFPAEGWDDFAVVVLSALLEAVERVLAGGQDTEFVHLMEGPFGIEVRQGGQKGELEVSAIERTRTQKLVRHVEVIPAPVLIAEILSAARLIARWCYERGWQADEVAALVQSATARKRKLTE